jgi:hypothetical protein
MTDVNGQPDPYVQPISQEHSRHEGLHRMQMHAYPPDRYAPAQMDYQQHML